MEAGIRCPNRQLHDDAPWLRPGEICNCGHRDPRVESQRDRDRRMQQEIDRHNRGGWL